MKLDRKVTIGFLVAVLVQTGGALVWAGAAATGTAVLASALPSPACLPNVAPPVPARASPPVSSVMGVVG